MFFTLLDISGLLEATDLCCIDIGGIFGDRAFRFIGGCGSVLVLTDGKDGVEDTGLVAIDKGGFTS